MTPLHKTALGAAFLTILTIAACGGPVQAYDLNINFRHLPSYSWEPSPRIIHVVPEQTEEALYKERLWVARCDPRLTTDKYGVGRFVYAKPGCEFGQYRDN